MLPGNRWRHFQGHGSLQQQRVGMTKSELIDALARKQSHLPFGDVQAAVKVLLDRMCLSLTQGERIEIRGFGSFSLHFRPERMGRNPKTGEQVALPGKYAPHFKPGKLLRTSVNKGKIAAAQTHVDGR